MMKLKSKLQGVALSLAAILFTLAPIPVEAQEPAPPQQETGVALAAAVAVRRQTIV